MLDLVVGSLCNIFMLKGTGPYTNVQSWHLAARSPDLMASQMPSSMKTTGMPLVSNPSVLHLINLVK